MTTRDRLALLLFAALSAGCFRSSDDDDDGTPLADPLDGAWAPGFALPGPSGFGAQVFAAVVGTDGATTYVGGIFEQVGETPAANIAKWDGATWSALGDGLPGIVRAISIDSAGTLVAGGELGSDVVPNHLYAFDGTAWVALPGDISGAVNAIVPQGDSLLVGGSFADAGASGATSIARYDNGTWTPLSGTGVLGPVKAISVVDADSFCAGGGFIEVDGVSALYVACNDAGTWTQLGDGLPGEVSALVRDLSGDWIAGGTLTFVIDPMGGDYEAGIAKLTAGTWAPLAGGVDGGFINDVRAIHVASNGDLVVGGTFGLAGSVTASNIARLSGGTTWSQVGGGVVNQIGVFLGAVIGVNVIVPHGASELLVGGVFSHAGDTVATNVAVTEAGTFTATVAPSNGIRGLSGFADAIAIHPDGSLVVAGGFSGVGHTPVANIARYSEGVWSPLGTGIPDGIVRAIVVLDDGTMIAGGDFASLRRYEDMQWVPFAPGVANVFVLAVDDDGTLYAAGDFDEFIARWDGDSWESLDGGLDGRPTSMAFDSRGRLVAGGLFSTGSGEALNGIGRYSSGSWHGFGGGLDGGDFGYVSDVAFVDGDLVIAGSFGQAGGVPVTSLARWNGDAWEEIADFPLQFGQPPTLIDIEPYDDGFFVTGTFTDIPGAAPASYIAWFDGTSWHPLDEGLSDLAEELLVQDSTLWCAGPFVNGGGRVSSGIAAWVYTPGP